MSKLYYVQSEDSDRIVLERNGVCCQTELCDMELVMINSEYDDTEKIIYAKGYLDLMRQFETPDAIWARFTDDDPEDTIYPPISDVISDNDKVLAEIEF